MEAEKRKQDEFCPIHEKVYRVRQGEFIICVGHNCSWAIPARRENDKHIVTLGDLKKVYNGI